MAQTALHFASVALNADPVPQPKELTVAQKYGILAEQGSNCQKIKKPPCKRACPHRRFNQ